MLQLVGEQGRDRVKTRVIRPLLFCNFRVSKTEMRFSLNLYEPREKGFILHSDKNCNPCREICSPWAMNHGSSSGYIEIKAVGDACNSFSLLSL